jgi:hypothetical protein
MATLDDFTGPNCSLPGGQTTPIHFTEDKL